MSTYRLKRLLCGVAAAVITVTAAAGGKVFAEESNGRELYFPENTLTEGATDYSSYISGYEQAENSGEIIVLDTDSIQNNNSVFYENYEGGKGKSVYIAEGKQETWGFNVKKAGFYTLSVNYYPVEGYQSPIQTDILLDGKLPFKESGGVTFSRIWNDTEKSKAYDTQGNEILPGQSEFPRWMSAFAEDGTGYSGGALKYYLTEGSHTLTVKCSRENILIGSLEFSAVEPVPEYAAVAAGYEKSGYKSVSSKAAVTVQGENAAAKSDQTLYPQADRTSPSVEPYNAAHICYNTIGGSQWKTAGQWIEWQVELPESGLYTISAHFKQALKSGNASVRELYIDGSLPFAEAANITFPYKGSWQLSAISDENGTPYSFYLEKGVHTLRLKVGLGKSADVLLQAGKYLSELNRIYREIVVVTGASPDMYRSYNLDKVIPDTIADMKKICGQLKELEKSVSASGGGTDKNLADIKRIYVQLEQMTADSDTIPKRLTNFKDNISSFGAWINLAAEQPLELDYIAFNPLNRELGKGDAGFLAMTKHYLTQFVWSFVTDYASVGQMTDDLTRKITVWQTTGRDQAQVLKSLINSSFTPKSSVSVDLQLVSANSLMSAILAGIGPDVSLGVGQDTPMNLALRNAVTDLSQFPDLSDLLSEFSESTCKPFRFGDGIYALPETINYPMLFYRKDILKELGIEISDLETWDKILKNVLPTLKKSSLSFGVLPSMNNYLMFLYQRGGRLYTDGGKNVALDSAEAVGAMRDYSMLYTQYGLELAFDFANRFRSGEMPVAVTEFTAYNQLTVFAPEIKGVWGMLPVPGRDIGDGINHSCISTVSGDIILAKSKDKESSWEFLKWWLSAETQVAYGKSIESTVGSAARYNTANSKAFGTVQWDSDVRASLMYQSKLASPIDEVPGGYFTSRLYDFAFRDIVYKNKDVRAAMTDAALDINTEMRTKREEYGLE